MTDVTVETSEVQSGDAKTAKRYTVPLKGGAGHVTLENIDDVPNDYFVYIIQMGLETIINSAGGMPKLLKGITKLDENEQSKQKAAVRKLAQENIKALLDGTLKQKGERGAVKVSGAVEKEALRLAKEMFKDILRENGIKISSLKASEHTAAAKEILKDNPDIYVKAEANLKEREEGAKTTAPIDLKKIFGAKLDDPSIKAKPKGAGLKAANEAKAKAKAAAGVTTKEKPKAEATQPKGAPKVAPRQEVKHQQSAVH